MTKLLLAFVVATLASCEPLQPPPGTPECPTGTVPAVCPAINTATCHPMDSLERVVGCFVADHDDPRIKLVCVDGC